GSTSFQACATARGLRKYLLTHANGQGPISRVMPDERCVSHQPGRAIMALRDPIAAYNAANNAEAQFLCDFLLNAGIEAYTTPDESLAGFSILGPMPEIHRPQVWIDKSDVERAGPLLADFERRQADRDDEEVSEDEEPIAVVCD